MKHTTDQHGASKGSECWKHVCWTSTVTAAGRMSGAGTHLAMRCGQPKLMSMASHSFSTSLAARTRWAGSLAQNCTSSGRSSSHVLKHSDLTGSSQATCHLDSLHEPPIWLAAPAATQGKARGGMDRRDAAGSLTCTSCLQQKALHGTWASRRRWRHSVGRATGKAAQTARSRCHIAAASGQLDCMNHPACMRP